MVGMQRAFFMMFYSPHKISRAGSFFHASVVRSSATPFFHILSRCSRITLNPNWVSLTVTPHLPSRSASSVRAPPPDPAEAYDHLMNLSFHALATYSPTGRSHPATPRAGAESSVFNLLYTLSFPLCFSALSILSHMPEVGSNSFPHATIICTFSQDAGKTIQALVWRSVLCSFAFGMELIYSVHYFHNRLHNHNQ